MEQRESCLFFSKRTGRDTIDASAPLCFARSPTRFDGNRILEIVPQRAPLVSYNVERGR